MVENCPPHPRRPRLTLQYWTAYQRDVHHNVLLLLEFCLTTSAYSIRIKLSWPGDRDKGTCGASLQERFKGSGKIIRDGCHSTLLGIRSYKPYVHYLKFALFLGCSVVVKWRDISSSLSLASQSIANHSTVPPSSTFPPIAYCNCTFVRFFCLTSLAYDGSNVLVGQMDLSGFICYQAKGWMMVLAGEERLGNTSL